MENFLLAYKLIINNIIKKRAKFLLVQNDILKKIDRCNPIIIFISMD